jgi:hypothetical protein
MRQALALAERRFLQLCHEAGVRGGSSGCPRGPRLADDRYLH